MKKTLSFAAVAVVTLVLLASCGKRCWCYQALGGGVTETSVYTDDYNECNTLSTLNRTCVEDAERMDPSQIAYK